MRVLFTNEAPLIKYGLAQGFRQAGHESRVIQGEKERLWGQSVEIQAGRLGKAIEEFKPDVVFTEGHPGFDPDTVCQVCAGKGVPHFYWAIEDPVCTESLSLHYARRVDYVFTTTAECIPRYEAMGKKAEVLLFGCNPEFHRYTGVCEKCRHDIVLVASNYSSRYEEAAWFVLPLVRAGFDIKVWGLWWDDPSRPVNLVDHPGVYGGLLPYEELSLVYSSAKIILGVNCDDTSMTQTSMRPYEALACGGGLYLAHYTKAQENLLGPHIIQVHNTEETLNEVKKILDMGEEQRRERASKAREYVCEKHSYRLRAEQVARAFFRLRGG